MNEANAIGTAMLRVVKTRIAFTNAALDERAIATVRAQSRPLQDEIWELTRTASEASPTPITATFIQSVNETFDLDDARLAAIENRIPFALWAMLSLLSLLAAYMLGTTLYQRSPASIIVPPLMIAIVVALIADLDTPRSGVIHEDARTMERLLPARR